MRFHCVLVLFSHFILTQNQFYSKLLINQYWKRREKMKKFLLVLFLFASAVVLYACKPTEDPDGPQVDIDYAPKLVGVTDVAIYKDAEFDVLQGVSATDEVDGNLTSSIKVFPTSVDTSDYGDTVVFYSVTNSKGLTTTLFRVVSVVLMETHAQGEYNFKFASSELRNTFFAAAEKWLLDTGAGGVPLFANAGFSMFSDRMALVSETSLPVLGFGTGWSTMTADDSTVTVEGVPGQAGKYTYRAALSTNPTTFNAWISDDSNTSDAIDPFLGALYGFNFNEDKTGYVLSADLAGGDPIPHNETVLDSGVTISKVWRVPVREGLKWSFHPSVDTTGWDLNITAQDFIDTYKLALDLGWFRAISGGGHFWASSNPIVGAQDYRDKVVAADPEDPADWDDVGIKIVTVDGVDYLEYEFEIDLSSWNVRYWLGSNSISPISMDLYNSLTPVSGVVPYGTTPETTAYHGAYVLDYYEADQVLRYSKNPNYHTPDEIFFTGRNYQIIATDVLRFQSFIAGDLDSVGVPTNEYENYKNDPRLKRVPGATTFRMGVNAFQTKAVQEENFPADTYGDWMPKAILGYADMQKALYFGVERDYLAYDILKTSEVQQFHFTDAYLVDPESGISFRDSAESALVEDGLSVETHGYSAAAATAFYKSAVAQAVADGFYTPGTAANPREIELTLVVQADSVGQANLATYLTEQYEDLFKDDVNHINIKIKTVFATFPDNYYSHALIGQFDLVVGGISGSTLDAASFLEVYASDNRGGFTFAWGFDTSVPEIEVTYEWDGATVTEIWSFDAIQMALNGDVYVVDGREAPRP